VYFRPLHISRTATFLDDTRLGYSNTMTVAAQGMFLTQNHAATMSLTAQTTCISQKFTPGTRKTFVRHVGFLLCLRSVYRLTTNHVFGSCMQYNSIPFTPGISRFSSKVKFGIDCPGIDVHLTLPSQQRKEMQGTNIFRTGPEWAVVTVAEQLRYLSDRPLPERSRGGSVRIKNAG
jgi:hypothetical protein